MHKACCLQYWRCQAVLDSIPKTASDKELNMSITSLEESRAEWSKLAEAVKQCLKDLKAEDQSQKSLAKKLKKRDDKRRDSDVRAAAEADESAKRQRLGGLFQTSALRNGNCIDFATGENLKDTLSNTI